MKEGNGISEQAGHSYLSIYCCWYLYLEVCLFLLGKYYLWGLLWRLTRDQPGKERVLSSSMRLAVISPKEFRVVVCLRALWYLKVCITLSENKTFSCLCILLVITRVLCLICHFITGPSKYSNLFKCNESWNLLGFRWDAMSWFGTPWTGHMLTSSTFSPTLFCALWVN